MFWNVLASSAPRKTGRDWSLLLAQVLRDSAETGRELADLYTVILEINIKMTKLLCYYNVY